MSETRYVYVIGDGIKWPTSIHETFAAAKTYALENLIDLQWEDTEVSGQQYWKANFSAWSIWKYRVGVKTIDARGRRS